MKKHYVWLFVFSYITHAMDNKVLQGTSFFSPRSQTTDSARHIVGWHPFTHVYDASSWYALICTTPEATHSFQSDRLAQALFGTDKLSVSGSLVEDRGGQDILADYFGLSPAYDATICLNPTVIQFLIEFGLYIGFDEWIKGLYLEIFAPVVWTKWHLEMKETDLITTGTDVPFPILYMDTNAVDAPIKSFTQALSGNVTFGQMTNSLQFGKVCGARTKGGLSDLLIILGYDVISNENGYASFNARLAAPTGSRPHSEYLFEPVIGNGKHWEFGLGFAGRGLIWEKDGWQKLNIFVETNFTHLFKARQCRSFDFCENGFGSRYTLLKEFDTDGNYNGSLLPAINVSTLSCNVSVALQFEFLFMFGYTHKGWVFDIGYNGWLRSHEKIDLLSCIESNKYGFKGIQDTTTILGDFDNTTQSSATLFGNDLNEQAQVADIDSPVFISTSDLNIQSAASPLVLTHKLFTHFGYAWKKGEHDSIIPFFGGGFSVEFEGINVSNYEKPNNNTLSEWGFWLKGGINFS